jgi:hypothetical protein
MPERRLRANPAFELVLFDRLPARQRQALAELAGDPEHYGVLRPRRGSGLGLKSIDRETALLFLTLARPGPLPGYVRSRLGDAGAALALARLVADGVLEIEREAGDFASGAAAMALFGRAGAPGGRLAELSRAALRYGEELARTLPDGEALRLSYRLYGYHRLPLTPGWRRRLPDADAVRRFLGLAGGGAWRSLLGRHWRERAAAPGEAWLHWHPLTAAALPAAPEGAATYKLYVSPAPEALPECFGPILDGLAAAGAPGFKVGATAGGLLRPDKVVAYFSSFEDLAEAADAVDARLSGIASPHGVPFSSEIAGGGLLSWGVDPPPTSCWGLGAGAGRMSWRLWLTHRLARALLAGTAAAMGRQARRAPEGAPAGARAQEPLEPVGPLERLEGLEPLDGMERSQQSEHSEPLEPLEPLEPWRFAVERLRLEGIDTDSWTPGASLWRQGESAWP